MCSNVRICTYYRSIRKYLFFNSLNLCHSLNCAKSLRAQKSLKYGASGVIDDLLRTLWRPWCSRPYSLEMTKISISNFIAPKCCKLCICNCLCAKMCLFSLIIAQSAKTWFLILRICFSLNSAKKSVNSGKSLKHGVSGVVD